MVDLPITQGFISDFPLAVKLAQDKEIPLANHAIVQFGLWLEENYEAQLMLSADGRDWIIRFSNDRKATEFVLKYG